MTIHFEYDQVQASKRLEAFATEKLESLFNKFSMIIRADVFFKLENTTSDENRQDLQHSLKCSWP